MKKWCCSMIHSSPPEPCRPALAHFLPRVSKAREGAILPSSACLGEEDEGTGEGVDGALPVYLPRAEGDEPGVLAKGALLYLVHKLGQLGVGPTAVINLRRGKAGDFKDSVTSSSMLCTSRNAMGDGLREWGKGPHIYTPKAR